MTPEQANARAALLLIHRLVRDHGLSAEDAATAVAQRRRREDGPHTHLVVAEAHAVLAEAMAPASRRVPWADVQKNQGSPVAVPSGLANALVIIADNTVHLAINAAALAWWG